MAFERFEDLNGLEEQELKRRHPRQVQLRDIAQHRDTQVQEFTDRMHRWIRIHQMVSIYLKNRAIGLTNDIKYYSDAAFQRFEDLDRLEEQELKRRNPSPVQLRDIAQHRETQLQEFTNKVYRWIRLHQRLIG
ncbi:hypothetical protein U1Q18_047210 [Sarracenia purpurea var. burkii]